jgi:hypothetical protein
MWAFLLGLIDPISRITGKIADAKIASAQASTDRERIAAEERVKTLDARRAVMVAEAGSRINAVMRFAIAFGPMLYLNKIFVWDKVLKLGVTDNLSDDLWKVVASVVGFYFLYEIAARWKR